MARFLHVANGTSTTDTIRQAGLPGRRSIWADVLYDGPVPGDLADDRLLELRARHLASSDARYPEVVSELQGWRAAIDEPSYDELVLWYEHDLFDQLNLIQLLDWIGRRSLAADVTLICVGSFPGRPRFKGLGELTPSELASLFETRQPVREAQYQLASRAWSTFRASDPRALESLLGDDLSALPYLARALRRLLEELPSTTDGLSRSERRLLELTAAGPIDVFTAFPLMSEGEDAYYITDGSLRQMLEDLGSAPSPLIFIDGTFDDRPLPDAVITITDTGRTVLAGQADRVRLRGIDRWLGGVHLQGSGPIWRWDQASERTVST
jgi:hypothetical protein